MSERLGDEVGQSTGNPHLQESLPYEWEAVETDYRTLIVRSVSEGTVECYVASTLTRNVRSLAHADAVLYDGCVVTPYFDEDIRSVDFVHDYAGRLGRHSVVEWLADPALRLKRLPYGDINQLAESKR